ncbi:MAG: extracellular solute-binding protein [Chloroflexi bacterium]|nr:extracellular solute-binding protein [Chloroflexota bacterium]
MPRSRLAVYLMFVLFSLLLSFGSVIAQDQPVTLTMWVVQSGGTAPTEAIIAEYEAANPNVSIALETRTVDGHKEAMRVAINTSAAPDIYFMWGGKGLGGFYTPSGGVEPLTAYYEQYGWVSVSAPVRSLRGHLTVRSTAFPTSFTAWGCTTANPCSSRPESPKNRRPTKN